MWVLVVWAFGCGCGGCWVWLWLWMCLGVNAASCVNVGAAGCVGVGVDDDDEGIRIGHCGVPGCSTIVEIRNCVVRLLPCGSQLRPVFVYYPGGGGGIPEARTSIEQILFELLYTIICLVLFCLERHTESETHWLICRVHAIGSRNLPLQQRCVQAWRKYQTLLAASRKSQQIQTESAATIEQPLCVENICHEFLQNSVAMVGFSNIPALRC